MAGNILCPQMLITIATKNTQVQHPKINPIKCKPKKKLLTKRVADIDDKDLPSLVDVIGVVQGNHSGDQRSGQRSSRSGEGPPSGHTEPSRDITDEWCLLRLEKRNWVQR